MNNLAEKKPEQKHLYWLLQIFGWFSIVFVETINYTFFIAGEFSWGYISSFGLFSISGLLVSHFYRKWFIKPALFNKSLPKIWVKAFFDVLIISVLITVIVSLPNLLTTGLQNITTNWSTFLIHIVFGQVMNIARYVLVWIIIYYLYHILQRNKEIMQEKLMAQNLAKTTELVLLKRQLNPHFLFNALNTIKALVLVDSDQAREAIIKLSEILRFSLNYEKNTFITIHEEMAVVKKYLELEKIRFGSRLSFSFNISPAIKDKKIPPAIILTLAENAIKHGISRLPEGGCVDFRIYQKNSEINIEVINCGGLRAANNNKGIGLASVRKRLREIFSDAATLQLTACSANKVSAWVCYPASQNQII